AEQGLADEPDRRSRGRRLDGGAEPGAARADDEDVVGMTIRAADHRRMAGSVITPRASSRTYTSARVTEMKLIQAHSMWCRFSAEMRCQTVYCARCRRVHEKQSRRPPAMWRSELQDRENPVRSVTFTKKITLPSPIRGPLAGTSDPKASIHRNVNGMNAR